MAPDRDRERRALAQVRRCVLAPEVVQPDAADRFCRVGPADGELLAVALLEEEADQKLRPVSA